MTGTPSRMTAARLQAGDRVEVDGQWWEVTAVRFSRYPSGGSAVTLTFRSAPALRMPAGKQLRVEQATKERH